MSWLPIGEGRQEGNISEDFENSANRVQESLLEGDRLQAVV